MELRSYNVEKVWKDSVICTFGEDLGINREKFAENIPNIKDMISQIRTVDNLVHVCECNKRKDGEQWTPYLQIVEMLLRMGKKIKCVEYLGTLTETTLVKIIL